MSDIEPYGRFDAKPASEYEDRESRELDRGREIYGSKRSTRPSYTRPDPGCECGLPQYVEDIDETGAVHLRETHLDLDHPYHGTVRVANVQPGYDKATFPIQRKNAISRMQEDELISPEGSLWRLQQLIGDAKFELLKQCIAAGVHMVSGIQAEVVVRVEAKVLTDKAGSVIKVKEGVEEISILLPNGEFRFGGY